MYVFCPWLICLVSEQELKRAIFEIHCVPQGSLLSPILFILHSVPLCSLIQIYSVCSVDPVPTSLLHDGLDDVLPTLSQIFHDSLLSGSFPSVFKYTIVKPLLKSRLLTTTTVQVQIFCSCLKSMRRYYGGSSSAT